jgi:replication factor A1
MYQLSAGICQRLYHAGQDDEELFNTGHTVQFLSVKKVAPSGSSTDRYRILFSDGEHYLHAMLATQLNYLVDDESIGKNTIALVERFTNNTVQGRR